MRHSSAHYGLPGGIRLALVQLVLIAGLLAIVTRAVQLQVFNGEQLRGLAEDQYLKELELTAPRGNIYDRSGRTLAVSVAVESIFVDPRKFVLGDAAVLAKALEMKKSSLLKKIGKRKSFAWIKRRVSPQLAQKVRQLDLKGVFFTAESKRFYPSRELAAHVLGFVGLDGKGLAGVELLYDEALRGRTADVGSLRDARGHRLSIGEILPVEELEGDELYLTIDAAIQHLTEEELSATMARFDAMSASAVVMDPHSGQILALATVPTYNPNEAGRAGANTRRNRTVTDIFEPGSTVKPLLVAAALDRGVIGLRDRIDCENGSFAIGRHVIRDTHPYKILDISDIISKSSNIGALKIGAKLGSEELYSALRGYGFGSKTGIELPGEVAGMLSKPQKWSQARLATISFGQGIGVSALQLTAAIASIANGGLFVRPHIVSKLTSRDGENTPASAAALPHRLLKSETCSAVTQMMEQVVQSGGTGERAAVPGVRVAGKTGTAQKADLVSGGYSADKRIASFVGFAPANEPKVVVLVVVDEPKGSTYGGVVAAPAFREIVRGTLRHLGVDVGSDDVAVVDEARKLDAVASTLVEPAPIVVPVVNLQNAAHRDDLIPDFRGMDARIASSIALRSGLELRIEGSGRVVKQSPAPGTKTRDASEIELHLSKGREG